MMVLSAFPPPEKGARRVAKTVSNPPRTPANLILCPYVPRIANEPSTWPITVHCGTSKTHSLHRTTISASPLLRYSSRPSISSFLTIRIPHGTLQNNGVAGGRTNRPAERTILHFYISMQNGEKKRNNLRIMYFLFFSATADIFIEKFLHLTNFIKYRRYITRLKIKLPYIFNSRIDDSLQILTYVYRTIFLIKVLVKEQNF